jgi:peroxiredoxin
MNFITPGIRTIPGLVLITSILVACGGGQQKAEGQKTAGWEVSIRGKVGFPQGGEIRLTEIRQDQQKPVEDTIKLKSNYTFDKKVKLKEAGFYRINFYNKQFVNVILDKSNIEVNVDGNDSGGFFEVKGSPDIDLINQVQKMMQDAQSSDEIRAIESEYQVASSKNDEKKLKELQEKYMAVLDVANDKVASLIEKQPPSLGVINMLQNGNTVDRDRHFAVYESTAAKLQKAWPDNSYAKTFIAYVVSLKKTAIGQPAPEISLPNPEGKVVTLSSFKGKYVLVDFWAKWCGPCRAENPNVVKAYNEFKGKGFDILGVSLDRTKEDWVRAIKEDGLAWTHVSDLKYFDSKAARDYNISGIPFSILVDPKGIIVAKNLRGSALQKKLAEVLK